MSQIVITGASGFVGTNLTAYLAGHGIPFVSKSLRSGVDDFFLPEDVRAVVHLAGKAHDLKNVSDPSEYFDINTELTKKLFIQFILSKATVFIFLSSVKASADTVEGILTEQDEPHPSTVYGKSKLLAEQFILSQKLPSDKRVYILRPCIIHGPGNKGNLNLLYRIVQKKIPYPLAAFENKRSFLSIENLCFVINELLERNDIEPGVYNIADDVPLSTNDVIRLMAGELSRRANLLRINKSIVKGIARVGDWLSFPLNTERLYKLTENYIVSTKKLNKALDKPLPVSSTEGIKISARYFSRKTR